MSLSTLAALSAAPKSVVDWLKSMTSSGTIPQGMAWPIHAQALTGASGAVLPTTGIANGVIPTPTLYPGSFPPLPVPPGGQSLYLRRLRACLGGAPGSLVVFDELFRAGDWAMNAAVNNALVAPPTIPAARLPGGDYKSTELWLTSTGAWDAATVVQVQYTNQDGVAGRLTAVGAPPATLPALPLSYQLALQPGDTGVEKLESVNVTSAGASANTFFASVIRPICQVDLIESAERVLEVLELGAPAIPADFALNAFYFQDLNGGSTVVACSLMLELATG